MDQLLIGFHQFTAYTVLLAQVAFYTTFAGVVVTQLPDYWRLAKYFNPFYFFMSAMMQTLANDECGVSTSATGP